VQPSEGVVAARDAATVIVARDAPVARDDRRGGRDEAAGSLEVLLLRRNVRAEFAAGVYVFPGGAVEDSDRADAARRRCVGLEEETADLLLGVAEGGLAFYVAAIRECFEEAGILFARRGASGGAASRGTPVVGRAELAEARAGLVAGRGSFVEWCAANGLWLAADELRYFSHWITPVGAPRRYDTRFFVARLPAGQEASHDAGETVDALWIGPGEALRRHRAGELDLVFPTVKHLEALEAFHSASELWDAAGSVGVPPTVQPRLAKGPEGLRVLLPGDPGFEEAG